MQQPLGSTTGIGPPQKEFLSEFSVSFSANVSDHSQTMAVSRLLFVECIVWFGDLSVEPDLGLGKIDFIIPNDTIAVGIGMSATKEGLIPQRAKDFFIKKRFAIVESTDTVVEGDQQSLARYRTYVSDLRVCRGCCHILLQTREFHKILSFPHPLQFAFVLLRPVTHQVLCPWREVTLNHLQGVYVEHSIKLGIDCMKMRHTVLTKVHFDQNPIETCNNRHFESPYADINLPHFQGFVMLRFV